MSLRGLLRQPFVAIAGGTLAFCLVVLPPLATGSTVRWSSGSVVLGLALAVVVASSYRFPIHISNNLKLYMATVPLFILAVTTTPVIAALLAAGSVLTGEMLARRATGAYPSDMVTSSARYCLVVLATSTVSHVEAISTIPEWLVASVLVYWPVEALTLPLILSPVSGEHPARVVRTFIRELGLAEGGQYVLGVIGALLALNFAWALPLLLLPTVIVYTAFKHAREMQDTTVQMLESMADAVDLRDPYTGGHSRRVAEHTRRILRELGKGGQEAQLVISAARVHDIGKIGLPDSVLLKDGRLSDEEQKRMQTHPEAGAQLLRRYKEFARGIDVVRHHHERWDGLGYPGRVKGQEIPFGARIVAVADSYDAMTTDRPYRKGLPQAIARKILLEGRGTQWDPEIVTAFIAVLDTETLPAKRMAGASMPTALPAPVAA